MRPTRVYLDEDWERVLKACAKYDHRPVSQTIRHAIIVWLRRNHGKRIQLPKEE